MLPCANIDYYGAKYKSKCATIRIKFFCACDVNLRPLRRYTFDLNVVSIMTSFAGVSDYFRLFLTLMLHKCISRLAIWSGVVDPFKKLRQWLQSRQGVFNLKKSVTTRASNQRSSVHQPCALPPFLAATHQKLEVITYLTLYLTLNLAF